MKNQKDTLGMLDLFTVPGFCVTNQKIVKTNAAASSLFLSEGMDIAPLLKTGAEEYRTFTGGCLHLSVSLGDTVWHAAVTRHNDTDVFLLEKASGSPELQAMALASSVLRSPLGNAMLITDKLLAHTSPEDAEALSRLNRNLYQLLRIVGNMSDAAYQPEEYRLKLHNIDTVVGEITEKVRHLADISGIQYQYTPLNESLLCLCDPDQLERALLNLLSNAIKFTPKGGRIDISLTRIGHTLRLSVQDSGSGIAGELLGSVFTRYTRQPAIEDGRFGIGLGMAMVRSAAAQHGGAVLIDQPGGTGTRVTMTIPIRQDASSLRSQILCPLSGGYDNALIELSEILPHQMYNGTK